MKGKSIDSPEIPAGDRDIMQASPASLRGRFRTKRLHFSWGRKLTEVKRQQRRQVVVGLTAFSSVRAVGKTWGLCRHAGLVFIVRRTTKFRTGWCWKGSTKIGPGEMSEADHVKRRLPEQEASSVFEEAGSPSRKCLRASKFCTTVCLWDPGCNLATGSCRLAPPGVSPLLPVPGEPTGKGSVVLQVLRCDVLLVPTSNCWQFWRELEYSAQGPHTELFAFYSTVL